MSTCAYAKIFVYNKEGKVVSPNIDVNVNYMKSLLFGSDWPDELEGYEPKHVDFPDITIDFIGFMKRSLLKNEDVKKHFKDGDMTADSVCVDDWFDTTAYQAQRSIINNIKTADDSWIKLYRKNSNYSITWVTEGILADYVQKLKGVLNKNYENLHNKKAIKNSVEYYKLTDEQKESLNNDISYAEDDIDETFDKVESLRQLIGLMDGMKEQYEESWEDEVVAALYLC